MLPHFNSSIYRDNVELFGGQFEGLNLICDLNAKFSCWQYDQELDVMILEQFLMSESLDYWQ